MNAQEWSELEDLLAMVEKAVLETWGFIANHMEREIKSRLGRAGVPNYVEDAYQDCLLNLRRNLSGLQQIDLFEAYVHRVVMSSAKKYRLRMVTLSKLPQQSQEKPARPREIGSKTLTMDGNPQIVRVFEPNPLQVHVTRRTSVFEPCSDAAIANWSKMNFADCIGAIDVRNALRNLPERWAKALVLVYVEGRSPEEAAKIMRISINRLNKLLQKAKQRMRKLLAGYAESGLTIVQAPQRKAKPARAKQAPHLSRSLGHVAVGKEIHISRTVSKGLLYVTGTRLAP